MNPLKTLAVTLFLALLAGCSAKPLSPTGYAIYDTLQTDAQLRSWVVACQQLSPELQRNALLTQRNWWQRNAIFVESADFGLAYDQLHISAERAETGARLALAATWNVVATADQSVQQALAKGDAAQTCQKALNRYDQGDFDLGGNNPYHAELEALRQRKLSAGDDFALQQASVTVSSGKEYGRSFYVVERLVNRQGCPNADVRLLKNDWPNEVYDARCGDRSYLLVQCEWGNCRISE